MNNHAAGSIWQTSRIKLEQQLWAQIAADMHACALGRQCSQTHAERWLWINNLMGLRYSFAGRSRVQPGRSA